MRQEELDGGDAIAGARLHAVVPSYSLPHAAPLKTKTAAHRPIYGVAVLEGMWATFLCIGSVAARRHRRRFCFFR